MIFIIYIQLYEQEHLIKLNNNNNNEQHIRLLNLEKKELLNQQTKSEHYIRFLYLLMKRTSMYCNKNNINFSVISSIQQNIVLNMIVNEMYVYCQLPLPLYYSSICSGSSSNNNSNNNIPYNNNNDIYTNIEEAAELVKCLYKIDPKLLHIQHTVQPVDSVIDRLYREYKHYLQANKVRYSYVYTTTIWV